ncbi:hypothetical protein KM043_009279 [Ampulex compressa]|nr:hypothetical protein KM043_009279 [Ampulex compressa]
MRPHARQWGLRNARREEKRRLGSRTRPLAGSRSRIVELARVGARHFFLRDLVQSAIKSARRPSSSGSMTEAPGMEIDSRSRLELLGASSRSRTPEKLEAGPLVCGIIRTPWTASCWKQKRAAMIEDPAAGRIEKQR